MPFLFLQPKETAAIINSYLEKFKKMKILKKISDSFDRGSEFYELNPNIQKNICIELLNFYKKISKIE